MLERLGESGDKIMAFGLALLFGFAWAGLGRGIWYAAQIKQGRTKFAVGVFLLEGCTALFCAALGLGITEHMGWEIFSWRPVATCAFLGWLGPNGAFMLGTSIVQRKWPEQPSTKKPGSDV